MVFSARTFFQSHVHLVDRAGAYPRGGLHQLPLIAQDETFVLRTSTVRFEPIPESHHPARQCPDCRIAVARGIAMESQYVVGV
jgi:hypothetical protein